MLLPMKIMSENKSRPKIWNRNNIPRLFYLLSLFFCKNSKIDVGLMDLFFMITQGKKGKVVREQTGNISFMLEKLKIIWSLFMSPFGN